MWNARRLGRMHSLTGRLLPELRSVDLDEASMDRAARITHAAVVHTGSAVPAPLLAELARLVGGARSAPPSVDELRVIDAMLLGWIQGIADGESIDASRRAS